MRISSILLATRDQHVAAINAKSSVANISQPLGKKSAGWSTTGGTGLTGLGPAKQKQGDRFQPFWGLNPVAQRENVLSEGHEAKGRASGVCDTTGAIAS
jgi:hypothetical protein